MKRKLNIQILFSNSLFLSKSALRTFFEKLDCLLRTKAYKNRTYSQIQTHIEITDKSEYVHIDRTNTNT